MNFINKLKSLFFNEVEVGIINLGDIIQIPGRDYYKDDIEKINLIDSYKEQYLQLLSQKRTITTRELKFDNLQEDMIMNVDLLLHSIITDEHFLNLASEELMIQMAKLKIYLLEINKMEVETITRLIALKELEKGKRVPRRNKNCLTDEINNLSNSLVIFLGQKTAIQKEIDAHLRTISINNSGKDYDILLKRWERLCFISSSILELSTVNRIDDLITKIAIVERWLEIYAYKNKNEIKILDSQLEELNNIEKTKDNKNDLLHKINGLEQKYLLFYEYGRNVVSDEQIKNLYKVKFNILTCDIDFLRESPIREDDYGYEYYKDIIFNKLQNIILGKNNYFNNTFPNDMRQALSIIREYYKGDWGGYDGDYVLYKKYMLNLLLSFDKEDGFKKMLSNNILLANSTDNDERNEFENIFSNISGIEWDYLVPLVSLLSIIDDFSCNHPINRLYQLMKKSEINTTYYKLPEGIISIDSDILSSRVSKYIRREIKDKKELVMPSTLKSISGNLFNSEFQKLSLNSGLEYIGPVVFDLFKGESISIPSSVSYIDEEGIGKSNLEYINFEDFEHSKLLNNKEAFGKFLTRLLYLTPTGNKQYYTVDKETKERQKAYSSGRYTSSDHRYLLAHDEWYYEYKIIPMFEKLYFNHDIYIDSSELIISFYTGENIIFKQSIDDEREKDRLMKIYTMKNFIPKYPQIQCIVERIYDIIEEKKKKYVKLNTKTNN